MVRKIQLFITSLCLLLLLSCKKDASPVVVPTPAAEATLTRNLKLVNQGGLEKTSSHGPSATRILAVTDNGRLGIQLETTGSQPGSVIEILYTTIDRRPVGLSMAGIYTFGSTDRPLRRVRYTYSAENTGTGSWANIIDSGNGVIYEGYLTISFHDILNKRISGSYFLTARRLLQDPTVNNSGTPIDPLNTGDLTLSGTFSNLALP